MLNLEGAVRLSPINETHHLKVDGVRSAGTNSGKAEAGW